MDIEKIRRVAIVAMFSDDDLRELLVLKGGNALNLVHGISPRVSMDLDFSMSRPFTSTKEAAGRMNRSLRDRFDAEGYTVFDVSLEERPKRGRGPENWGGYVLEFKLIAKVDQERLGSDETQMRRNAVVVALGQKRKMRIEISHHEDCRHKEERDFDGFSIFVYLPAAIAAEKLRAICQQMDGYRLRRHAPSARARDFYDICRVLDEKGVDLRSELEMVKGIFAAKDVPLSYLGRIRETREFHRPDWPAVEAGVAVNLEGFDAYFERVVGVAEGLLEALGEE